MIGVRADFSGALHKSAACLNVGRAMRFQASRWAAETVAGLRRSAAAMQKAHAMGHNKTGQLARSVGMKVASASERTYSIAVGTGLAGFVNSKYARIQDEGGTVRAKNASFTIQNIAGKPTLGPYLTVPLRGVKGRMKDYPGAFVIRSKKGTLLAVQPLAFKSGARKGQRKTGKAAGLRPLFVLKFSVDIPASRWFTGVIERREPELEGMMDPQVVMNIAGQLAGTGR